MPNTQRETQSQGSEVAVAKPAEIESARPDEAQIERALVELAACSGNTHKAARHLGEDGFKIDQKTLWRWRTKQYADRYERIRREQLPQIQAVATEQHMALARQQMELAQAAAGFVAARLDRMEDRDLVNAMGKADIGSGIHTEKAQLLSGLPTHRVERTSDELLRELEAEGLKLEAIDAEVVSEEDVAEPATVTQVVVTASAS